VFAKLALLVLLVCRLVGGAKPNVPMWVAKEFKFFCAVEKKMNNPEAEPRGISVIYSPQIAQIHAD